MEHTFVVCAYKENPYLEQCIKSLINQTVKSQILVSTSTPNDYIKSVANKYGLPIVVNKGLGDGADNFNFAFSQASGTYVTLCHQDDYYAPDYWEKVRQAISCSDNPIMLFTDYAEDRNSVVVTQNMLLLVKRIMLFPFRSKILRKSKKTRKFLLSFGDAICCPSVTYNKQIVSSPNYESKWKAVADWRVWINLAKLEGEFCYVPYKLVFHRIHEESDTSNVILNNIRTKEELDVYKEMWPNWFAKIISKLYALGQKSN